MTNRLSVVTTSLLLVAGCLDFADDAPFSPHTDFVKGPSARPGIHYESWAVGGATDQSRAAGQPDLSVLVTIDGNDVEDSHLATVSTAPAFRAGAEFIWVFSQCFGGGMIDDLAALGGTQTIATASRFNEVAYYQMPAPAGIGKDWLDGYLDVLTPGARAKEVARLAAERDPFGRNPKARRRGETQGDENPQYYQTAAATRRGAPRGEEPADPVSLDGERGASLAILWSGKPKKYDTRQIDVAITKLLAAGYGRDRIFVLFGSGRLGAKHPLVVKHMAGVMPPIRLRAATKRQLDAVLGTAFRAAAAPSQVFFLANDHGGRTVRGVRESTPRVGAPGDNGNAVDLDAASGQGEYGAGDDSDVPSLLAIRPN